MHRCVLLYLCILSAVTASGSPGYGTLKWQIADTLPPREEGKQAPGLAGAFAGTVEDRMVLAGGANFPGGPVWQGGTKVFHRDLYWQDTEGHWHLQADFFPFPLAYGMSAPFNGGLLCAGGTEGLKTVDNVYHIRWDDDLQQMFLDTLPSMPIPLANGVAGYIDNTVYVAGTDEAAHAPYFMKFSAADTNWVVLPPWPGPPRTHAYGGVQSDGFGDAFFLFKGRYRPPGHSLTTWYADGYRYRPTTGQWEQLEPHLDEEGRPVALAAGMTLSMGNSHLLIIGGDDGSQFQQIERLQQQLDSVTDSEQRTLLTFKRDSMQQHHPGFSRDIWTFNTITGRWHLSDSLPDPAPVTTSAFLKSDRLVIPSGEIRPSIRTPLIQRAAYERESAFGFINWAVVGVYLLLLVGMGWYFLGGQHDVNDFFRAGQRLPWWAVGLSIFGTQLSAITFMAIPAKTYATDWKYLFLNFTIIAVAPFIIRFFLPFYRRYDLMTAYQYLEWRFDVRLRVFGSLLYILLQLGRLGIVLLLPSLAISLVTGIDVTLCVLLMGLLSILYTAMGGIEAVIWTDVIQVVVLLGGALLSMVLLWLNLDTGTWQMVAAQGKLQIFDWRFDLSDATFWVVILGGLSINVVQYGSDQTVVQRYLTTKDEATAARSIWTGALMVLPATLIFFTLGTLLYAYYTEHPGEITPAFTSLDAIFPWYFVSHLPDGVAGLLLAAIFAASMSSLDSSMNSVAAVVGHDLLGRFGNMSNPSAGLATARWITVITGLTGTGLAVWMAQSGISSLWDQFNMIIGLFVGGLGGVFILGIFFPGVQAAAALWALVISAGIQWLVKTSTDINLLLYAGTGMISSILTGLLISSMLPASSQGRTYTLQGIEKRKS